MLEKGHMAMQKHAKYTLAANDTSANSIITQRHRMKQGGKSFIGSFTINLSLTLSFCVRTGVQIAEGTLEAFHFCTLMSSLCQ